jgi:hypothetical protein
MIKQLLKKTDCLRLFLFGPDFLRLFHLIEVELLIQFVLFALTFDVLL